MMTRDYKCFKCQNEFMELYENSSVAKNTAPCPECGAKAKRLYGVQVIIDDWSPTGTYDNQAQRDIEHFEKPVWKNGKKVARRAMYAEDQQKQGIPVNITEV